MGGKAFAQGVSPLMIPRMPTEIYLLVRDATHKCVRSFFRNVATLLEAPDKATYGEIDVLVSDPFSGNLPSIDTLTTRLAARQSRSATNSPTTSFAVPYPGRFTDFIQIDMHVCSCAMFEWQVFHHSHGELWNLLGTSLRPFGLTANSEGLNIRIEEIEASDKERSMVLLTREPKRVMTLLGINIDKCTKPFINMEEMYVLVTSCRFSMPNIYQRPTKGERSEKNEPKRGLPRFCSRMVTKTMPNITSSLFGFAVMLPGHRRMSKSFRPIERMSLRLLSNHVTAILEPGVSMLTFQHVE